MTRSCSWPHRHTPRPHEIDSHHKIPESWGGPSTPDNLIDLCIQCHHNTHFLINAYVKAKGVPDKATLKTYTDLERQLAQHAWDGRPSDNPPYTLTNGGTG